MRKVKKIWFFIETNSIPLKKWERNVILEPIVNSFFSEKEKNVNVILWPQGFIFLLHDKTNKQTNKNIIYKDQIQLKDKIHIDFT